MKHKYYWTLGFALLFIAGIAFGQDIQFDVPAGVDADPETDPIGFWVKLGIWIIQISMWLAVAWALLYFVAKLADGFKMWWGDREGATDTIGRIGGSVVIMILILAAAVFANGFLNRLKVQIDQAVALNSSPVEVITAEPERYV